MQPGFEPTSHHGYLTEKLALTTRPSCPHISAFSTPIDNRQPYMKSQCPEEGSPEALRMLQMPYRELIGALLWIANGTRPDIAFAVTTLAKYTSNPGETYWQAIRISTSNSPSLHLLYQK